MGNKGLSFFVDVGDPMSPERDCIHLKKALKDYLKEQGITLKDLLNVMDEDKEDIIQALNERVHLTKTQSRVLERGLSSKDLNLLLFVIQAFYLLNPSGMYKGLITEPARGDIIWSDKATFEGCMAILKSLGISTQDLDT